jgi:diguanylate cyclase (GGDEF)-like protein
MDRLFSDSQQTGVGPGAAELARRLQRLDELEHLVHERSAELTWSNERLVAALYERSAAEATAEDLRRIDRTTGLPNRHALEERLERAVRAYVDRSEPAAVLCVGIGRLAEVRDSLGLAAADAVARQVGERLVRAVRGSDTVARIGDDEFALVLASLRSGKDAASVARKLFDSLDAPLHVAGHELRLAPAIGVAVMPDDASGADLLLSRAAASMQYAREQNTGLYQFFRPEIAERAARRLRLESELRAALERDEFRVLFQPRVATRGGRVVGAEALLRWEHPQRGQLAPERFLDVAEESGLIVPIGARVLRLACQHARTWPGALSVAVNLAPREFRGTSIVSLVARALNEAGLPAQRLQIEIGEPSLMRQDEAATLDVLAQLHDSGVRIVLDNFGAGTASLGALRRVAIDGIKLDGDFVRNAAAVERDGRIVRSLVSLGKGLGLRVIAAGIESEEQLAFVRKAGCAEAQGYLLGRPLEPEAFAGSVRQPARRRARG